MNTKKLKNFLVLNKILIPKNKSTGKVLIEDGAWKEIVLPGE